MSKQLIDGIWVVVCDWPSCNLGKNGTAAMFVDPNAGKNPKDHFQCGRHHGIIPQKEREEFQLPKDHKLNQDILRPSPKNRSTEEVEDER